MQHSQLGRRNCFSIQVISKAKLQRLTRQEEAKEIRYVSAGEPKKYIQKVAQTPSTEEKFNIMTKSLARVATRWWKGHKDEIKTFKQASTLLCNRLEESKNIAKFMPDQDPQEHIKRCKEAWTREEIQKEEWTHRFAKTLDRIPYTWYQVEEANGNTKYWPKLEENFIKDFQPMNKEPGVQLTLSCI
eukprot:Gb_11745 [translate_table: standard]